MDSHLSDAQLFEALLGESNPRSEAHLGACPECRARLARLKEVTAAVGSVGRAQAEKPDGFWKQQRDAAMARTSKRTVSPLAWAGAVAVAILAAMLIQEPRPPQPMPTTATDPDQELLISVERATSRKVPQALAPAALITEEISRNVKPKPADRQSKGEPQ